MIFSNQQAEFIVNYLPHGNHSVNINPSLFDV